MIRTVNPATGQLVAEHPVMTTSEANRVLRASTTAFGHWKATSFAERAALVNTLGEALLHHLDTSARLISIEMGKPVNEARAEVEKCARACHHFALHAEDLLGDREMDLDGQRALVTCRPLGPLLAIMPWNFPFWQVFRAAVPALMAGNTVLLKHASNTTGCALAIGRIFHAAGFPEGVFGVLRMPGPAMGRIIRHPAVAAVTLTGSAEAGRKVARTAGAALKKTVLELGGSDPYLVLADADLDLAARVCAKARLINCGQSCIAAKRFIVVDSVREAFEDKLVREMTVFRAGDPLSDKTQLGPMARDNLRTDLHEQVRQSIAAGARLLTGGVLPAGPGFFYPPTVLSGVGPGMHAFDEETFGPVAAVISARDEADAIRLANASPYGLGSAVFTRDLERGTRIARNELHTGLAALNTFVQSDPRLPFGGVGDSGYGRELGAEGIREFTNVKSVVLGAQQTPPPGRPRQDSAAAAPEAR